MPKAGEHEKPTILIVDDEAGPRDTLRIILRPFFNIQLAETASSALQILSTHAIDLIALDQKLPDRQGMDLLQDIKHDHADIEVIIITGYGSVKSAMEGIRNGAAGYLLKPFNVTELITLVNHTLEKKRRLDFIRHFFRSSPELWRSEPESCQAWQALRSGYDTLDAQTNGTSVCPQNVTDSLPFFSDILEATDRQLLNHSSRVSFYASLMGARLNLTSQAQQSLTIGAFLHDIGRTRPTSFDPLIERGRFSCMEQSCTQHPLEGARLIRPLGLPNEISQIVSYHHERWDGEGYPHSLQGEDIPFLARIVNIAETFDHLTTEMPGHSPLTTEEAILRISLGGHTHFDPMLTDMFIEVLNKCKASLPHVAMSHATTFDGDQASSATSLTHSPLRSAPPPFP